MGDRPPNKIRCGGGKEVKVEVEAGGLKGERGNCVALSIIEHGGQKKSVDVGTATCCNVQQNNNLRYIFFAHSASRLWIHWTGVARQALR